MGRMKQGAKIGKVDCAYNEIKVGDTVRNKHTGAEYVVTSYGSLSNGNDVLSKWDPDDWRVVRTWDEGLRPAEEPKAKPVEECAEHPDSVVEEIAAEEPADDPLKSTAEKTLELEPEAARIDTPFSDIVKAKELVQELRMMGYTVTCSKSVFVEL